MHPGAYEFVALYAGRMDLTGKRILEIGSLDINGSVRPLFDGCAEYVGVDVRPGPGVDVVSDIRDYAAIDFDIILCLEVLEHDPQPEEIIAYARQALREGGQLILTAAAPPRQPHSWDGQMLRRGEHYANIEPEALRAWLDEWAEVKVEYHPIQGDVYARAVK